MGPDPPILTETTGQSHLNKLINKRKEQEMIQEAKCLSKKVTNRHLTYLMSLTDSVDTFLSLLSALY
jgi:hypothetical protein